MSTTTELIDRIAAHGALDETRLAATLGRLVATASVNPGTYEPAMLAQVMRELEDTGLETTVVEFAPGRPSLAAVLTGAGDGPALVLNGHMDTVPVGDRATWSVDPFGGEVRDGAVWGRGALDMKGGLAAQIACARALAAHRELLRGRLVLHFAAGEECGEPGTLSLLEHGFTGNYGIVTEPTDLAVATAMRGVVWHTIRITGRATHAGTARAGRNPVAPLPALIGALERYDAELSERTHALIGSPAASVTEVHAGVEHNAIPDVCEVVVDRRMIPGETPDAVTAELSALVASTLAGADGYNWAVTQLHNPFIPVEIDAGSEFAARLVAVAERETGGQVPIIGTPYGSDVRNLVHDAGIEAVTFGAGDVRGCHCPDEHLPIADLKRAASIITRVAAELLVDT
jgi:succinyl-diaminopimelate desuccinylase